VVNEEVASFVMVEIVSTPEAPRQLRFNDGSSNDMKRKDDERENMLFSWTQVLLGRVT
jgi:hypothetical protein